MNEVRVELGELQNSCFVVMPFSPLFQIEYEKVIKPTVEEVGIKCVRGDEIYSKPRIMDDIWVAIRSCRFVVAELSGKNPNVLYEVGLAHAIGKPVIIITRNADDVPFDLKALRYLFYDTDDPFWGDNLKKGLKSLIEKAIENPEIDNYLPDISKTGSIKYPNIEKALVVPKTEAIVNVSGHWVGEWTSSLKHEVTLHIEQTGTDISGTSIIKYEFENKTSVILQIMQGSIKNLKVSLQGVNYSYVERGATVAYAMDDFELNYNPGKDMLVGIKNDSYGNKAELSLKRL